jgi:peptidoglycan/LPS O-acetylase OafA/YrhL
MMSPAPPGPTTALPARLAGLDVIRALAALAVVLSHAWEAATIWSPIWRAQASQATTERIADVTRAMGAWGVGIFFVLSGLCVHLPMARKLASAPSTELDLGNYAWRRFWRIYPPHLLVIFLSIAAASVCPMTEMVTVPTWTQFVAHLAMVHTFVPNAAFSINHVLWTIALEAQFYVLYPLLLKARRRVPLIWLTAGLFMLGLAARGIDRYGLLPNGVSAAQSVMGRFWEWTLGAVAAEYIVSRRAAPGHWWFWVLASFAVPIATSSLPISVTIAVTISPFVCAIALISISLAPLRSHTSPALVAIGLRSYSLYLIHPIVFALAWLPFAALGAWGEFVAMSIAALLVACAYFTLVERPFMEKSARRASVARISVGT